GGIVYSTGLAGFTKGGAQAQAVEEFFFAQLSDTHWGFNGAKFNPDFKGTLPKAIAAINALPNQPDFIVFTGDLTHTTDDPKLRRKRMAEFREIVGGLDNQNIRFLPGEHDASLDNGEAYKEFFGNLYYSFDHKGIHFIALDNVSDPRARLGEVQLAWLAADLKNQKKTQPIVVLTHRPLFKLAPKWGWSTMDGQAALDLLMPYKNVTVFYGHIHQEHHHMSGHIAHHSAKSLIFPLPAPGSVSKKHKIPWDRSRPYAGLGVRSVQTPKTGAGKFKLSEHTVKGT
ncbi:MAG TPA: metallophosphoesterase, partial [Hellea balneolensis]|nr:metallophosphoesterase [Hellea balneolensis]